MRSKSPARWEELVASNQAIVLTGTGANAAYEAGVLQGLLVDHWGHGKDPVDPSCYCGTSTGAINAAVMVSRASQGSTKAVSDLHKIWLERIAVSRASSATGLFRVRAEPTQYFSLGLSMDVERQMQPILQLAGDSVYFMTETARRFAFAMGSDGTVADRAANMTELGQWIDVSPMVDLVNTVIVPGDIGTSPKRIAITALNWVTGKPQTFRNADLARVTGRNIILAAAAVPAVFPPQVVEGKPYVDASALLDVPLAPAVEAMRDASELEIHVVYVDASETDIPLPPVSNTFATAYRLFMLAVSRQVNNDIDRAARVNRQIKLMDLFPRMLPDASDDRPKDDISAAIGNKLDAEARAVWQDLSADTTKRRLLTIHKHRPRKNIYGFDLGQFHRQTIQSLIENGYEDAMNHDCSKNGCVRA
jgi:predicted acylesterase/phospholipase RssA